jgi:NitT/TauT family transport system substrate-binding protein
MIGKIRFQTIVFFVCIAIIGICVSSCNNKKDLASNSLNNTHWNISDSLRIVPIRVQLQWLHQAQFAGFYVAEAKGFYHNYGFDVSLDMGGPENPSTSALIGGKADFVSMFLTTALKDVDKGEKLVNLAQFSQRSSLLLVAKKSSGIRKIQDLNGKKIGLWMNDFTEPSITLLNKYQIQAQIFPVSWTTNVLSHDVVDVMNMMLYNEYDIFVNSGYEPDELTVFPLADFGVNIPEDGLYCRQDYYLANRDLCHEFAEATMDGWVYAMSHEDETLEIVLDYLRISHLPANIPHQSWMLKKIREAILYKPEQFGKLTRHDYNLAVEMLKNNRIIANYLPYEEFVGYESPAKN